MFHSKWRLQTSGNNSFKYDFAKIEGIELVKMPLESLNKLWKDDGRRWKMVATSTLVSVLILEIAENGAALIF